MELSQTRIKIAKKIRVLVVDDSAMVREILRQGLSIARDIEVVDVARDAFDARDKIIKYRPDVLTLDVEMPKMDGVEFLQRLMPQMPIPVLMVSSLTERGKQITMSALEAGAIDFVTKPSSNVARGMEEMMLELQNKVRVASLANVSHYKNTKKIQAHSTNKNTNNALAESTDKVIIIGASTGGTEAIKRVLSDLPANCPGVAIVQHMPAGFTSAFAQRLNSCCNLTVKESENGDRLLPGKVLLSPGGNFHMKVKRSGGEYRVELVGGDKVCGHRPSVEVLMESAAQHIGANAVGVILTGMGRDGATGLKAMRDAGARTIAQDEQSCIVFGMPKEAYACGGAEKLVPLDKVANNIMDLLRKNNEK